MRIATLSFACPIYQKKMHAELPNPRSYMSKPSPMPSGMLAVDVPYHVCISTSIHTKPDSLSLRLLSATISCLSPRDFMNQKPLVPPPDSITGRMQMAGWNMLRVTTAMTISPPSKPMNKSSWPIRGPVQPSESSATRKQLRTRIQVLEMPSPTRNPLKSVVLRIAESSGLWSMALAPKARYLRQVRSAKSADATTKQKPVNTWKARPAIIMSVPSLGSFELDARAPPRA